jgi:hypothetical protein
MSIVTYRDTYMQSQTSRQPAGHACACRYRAGRLLPPPLPPPPLLLLLLYG